jgi:hypothetical protein
MVTAMMVRTAVPAPSRMTRADKQTSLDEPRYERDQRSASPRPTRDEAENGRRRSASPGAGGVDR